MKNIKPTIKKSKIIAIGLYAILIGAVTGTYAWYSTNDRINATMGTLDSDEAGYQIGYQVFRYDEENKCGIKEPNNNTTMNMYDKVFPSRNKNSSIILRAILSDDYSNMVDENGEIELRLECAYMGTGRDNGDVGDGENEASKDDDIIDYLSNVINVKASYLPTITDNALNKTYDTSVYASDADYIYRAASEYFDENVSESVRFVGLGEGTPGINESETVYSKEVYTTTSAYNSRTDEKTTSIVENDDGSTTTTNYSYAYLISYGTNYMYIDGDMIRTTTINDNDLLNDSVMRQYGFTISRNGSTSTYSLFNNGKYISYEKGTIYYDIAVSNSAAYWTFSASSNLRASVDPGLYTYYIDASKNPVSVTRSSATSNNNLQITRIEKKVIKTYRDAAVSSLGNKQIRITAQLGGESQRSADDFYYMYIQLDYDPELIEAYFKENNLMYSVDKNTLGVLFKDKFSITVVPRE